MLQHVNEMMPYTSGQRSFHGSEHDKNCYESIIIILDTLEQCLANQPKDTTNFDETMNIKLLLREICQFISKRTVKFNSIFFFFVRFGIIQDYDVIFRCT